MNIIDIQTVVNAGVVALAACRHFSGRRIGNVIGGMTVGAPFAYMVSHPAPGMDTTLGQWALALVILGGASLIGLVKLGRGLFRLGDALSRLADRTFDEDRMDAIRQAISPTYRREVALMIAAEDAREGIRR